MQNGAKELDEPTPTPVEVADHEDELIAGGDAALDSKDFYMVQSAYEAINRTDKYTFRDQSHKLKRCTWLKKLIKKGFLVLMEEKRAGKTVPFENSIWIAGKITNVFRETNRVNVEDEIEERNRAEIESKQVAFMLSDMLDLAFSTLDESSDIQDLKDMHKVHGDSKSYFCGREDLKEKKKDWKEMGVKLQKYLKGAKRRQRP